jgi:hypothetical protein
MPIKFACPSCNKGYNVKDELAGKKARCSCGAVMPIPNDIPVTEVDPTPSEPHFGGDPLAFNTAATASVPTQTASSDSLFDEEFPSGGTIPATPISQQTSHSQLASHATGAGYAVNVPAVGPIGSSTSAAPETSSTGAGVAFMIGVGLSGVGAMVGAVIWAVIAIVTDHEIGWIAWGIGFCSGFGMAIAHNMSDGIDDFLGGVVASVMAVLGVLAGKAAVYQFVILAMLDDMGEVGEALEGEVSFAMMFGPMDALFFLLAIATAYRLGSGGGGDD